MYKLLVVYTIPVFVLVNMQASSQFCPGTALFRLFLKKEFVEDLKTRTRQSLR